MTKKKIKSIFCRRLDSNTKEQIMNNDEKMQTNPNDLR